ncbi:MAG TPA: thioredoxin family protein [Rhodocyclaceae bacterium]|nr:thioredoxin family protein [Rhodocyclaceae bacterium]
MQTNTLSTRRPGFWLALLVLAAAVAISPAHAAGQSTPFTQADFEALQAENALILVDVAADWCPTCRKQKQVIDAFRTQHPQVDLHVLTVDFDTQKEWVKHFKAPRQSTLVVYKGRTQHWFAVAETRQEVIFEALLKAAGQ